MDEHDEQPSIRPKGRNNLVLGLIAVLVLGAAAFWVLRKQPLSVAPLPMPARDAGTQLVRDDAGLVIPDAAAPEPSQPRNGTAVLRALGAKGSRSPELEKWLAADGILRRLAAAVRLVAEGRSPRAMVGFIQVPGGFSVVESWDPRARKAGQIPSSVPAGDKDRIFASPASYARYDGIAEILASADVEAWGRGYAELRPHLDEVFAEVARPGETFDNTLAAALHRLAEVDVPTGQAELISDGGVFLFKDPALEALSDAEKHLLRMGSKNARAIQSVIARFSKAAGLRPRPR
jgi:hypothetical protein